MTDHNDTGATARPKLTPLENVLVVMKSARRHGKVMAVWEDDVNAVEDAVNAYEPLKARLAEVEGQRAELASKLSHLVDSLKHAEARTLDAEASIAVLEKALERIAVLPECGCKPCTGQCRSQAVLLIELEEIRALALTALSTTGEEGK